MKRSDNKTVSPKMWTWFILIHAFGYTWVYGFSIAPVFFAYTGNYTPQDLLSYTYIIAGYMLVQYVLLQIFVGAKYCGRRCHLRMCLLDGAISSLCVSFVLFAWEAPWITFYCLLCNAIGLGSILLSTAITFLRTRHLPAPPKPENATLTEIQEPFTFVNIDVVNEKNTE